MPAKSKSQRRLMGMARAEQEGKDTHSSEAKHLAKTVSASKLDHFAKTKEAGLPNRVKKKKR